MKFDFLKFNKITAPSVSIGLDIGISYIKSVVLRKENNQIYLDNFCIKYAKGNIPRLLEQFVKESNIPVREVNISLSGKSTIVRDLWMPIMSHKELKVSLGYEIDQYIPFPVEDIYYDSYILEETPLTRKEKLMRVIIAVANKKIVNERIQWLKEAGLRPNMISMDAITLFNLYKSEGDNGKTLGLIDIGSSKTIINIISDKELTFTREVEYGTNKARDAAVRGLSVNQEEAEKCVCSGDPKITVWMHDLIAKLSKELWNSFEFYEGQEQKPVEKVYVTGGGILFPGLADILSQSIGLPVVVWSPINRININLSEEKKSEIAKLSPMLSIAIGLAYKSL